MSKESKKRRKSRRGLEEGSLEFQETWGASFYIQSQILHLEERIRAARLVELDPPGCNPEYDPGFTPCKEDWLRINDLLKEMLKGEVYYFDSKPKEWTDWEKYINQDAAGGYRLNDPFDFSDRSAPPDLHPLDREQVFKGQERYNVSKGWIRYVHKDSVRKEIPFWKDTDNRLEKLLRELSLKNGVSEATLQRWEKGQYAGFDENAERDTWRDRVRFLKDLVTFDFVNFDD